MHFTEKKQKNIYIFSQCLHIKSDETFSVSGHLGLSILFVFDKSQSIVEKKHVLWLSLKSEVFLHQDY